MQDREQGPALLWAEAWLKEVQEAQRQLARAALIARAREERAYSLGSPGTGGRGKGGVANPMAGIEEKIAGEQDAARDPLYAWARDTIDEFERMKAAMRPCLRGTLALGLDACELRYRYDYRPAAVAQVLCCGKTTVKTAIRAFIDYLDFLGRARAVPRRGATGAAQADGQ